MSDLAAWLTQILDEEESGWRCQAWQDKEGVTKPLFHFGQPLTDLLLADIAAKRAIIALHGRNVADEGVRNTCPELYPCTTLRLLASIYAGRTGYDAEWKP